MICYLSNANHDTIDAFQDFDFKEALIHSSKLKATSHHQNQEWDQKRNSNSIPELQLNYRKSKSTTGTRTHSTEVRGGNSLRQVKQLVTFHTMSPNTSK